MDEISKIIIDNQYMKCEFLNYSGESINPNLEIFRSECLFKILTQFIEVVTKKLGIEIFSIKKNYIRTLTNIFSSWLFVQYAREDCDKDPIIPSGNITYDTLIITLIDMMKYDNNINNEKREVLAIEIIESLDLKSKCIFFLNKINNYIKSEEFINSNNYEISKSLKIKKRKKELGNLEHYCFKISNLKVNTNNENVIKIIKNIKIAKSVYNKLAIKFTKYKESNIVKYNLDTLIWCLLFRYITLGSHNHQLAVIPSVMSKLKINYNLNIELFASGINHYFDNYCSLFYDIEKHFGSCGSFFNFNPIRGLFGFNPPYENNLMENGVNKIIKHLDNSEENKEPLGFIVTIPIWDKEGKNIMENEFNSKPGKNMSIDYGDYNVINIIKQSKYLKLKKMVPKYNFSYLDYFNMIYKDKTIQNTYIILLTNSHLNLDVNLLSSIDFKYKN
jgi:hypothetical protein